MKLDTTVGLALAVILALVAYNFYKKQQLAALATPAGFEGIVAATQQLPVSTRTAPPSIFNPNVLLGL